MRIFVILAAVILAAVILASVVKARSKPYDKSADAKVVLQTALAAAKTDHKPVFVIFGANWCDDCRALDHAIKQGRSAALIAKSFSVVKINVGNFDKNLDIVNTYGSPINKEFQPPFSSRPTVGLFMQLAQVNWPMPDKWAKQAFTTFWWRLLSAPEFARAMMQKAQRSVPGTMLGAIPG